MASKAKITTPTIRTIETAENLANNTNSNQLTVMPQNSTLRKCFTAILARKRVDFQLKALNFILRKELNIKLESLEADLVSILPYLLVYYINNWPGWKQIHEYPKGILGLHVWYKEFIQYIKSKLDYGINKIYSDLVKESPQEKCQIDKATQTEDGFIGDGIKSDAPFIIQITGKPSLLNNLIFSGENDKEEGSIIMTQQSFLNWFLPENWEHISVKQILSWPFVSVHFSSPILTFSRENVHEYQRFLTHLPNSMPGSDKTNFILRVKKVAASNNIVSIAYFRHIIASFIRALKVGYRSRKKMVEEYQVLMQEILQDIEECSYDGVFATNTSVLFNIGKCTYMRNKKVMKENGEPEPSSKPTIGYTEIIVPRVEALVTQVSNSEQVPYYMNLLSAARRTELNLPTIVFICTFCRISFKHARHLVQHYEVHQVAPPFLCVVCKGSYTLQELTNQRWGHDCRGPCTN